MTETAPHHAEAPGQLRRYIPVPDAEANLSADIVELIMADHRRIRRLCSAVYDAARPGGHPDPDWMLGHVWQRLADLLMAHTQAEEETCYASIPRAGLQATTRAVGARATGRAAADRAGGQARDPIADHEDIRKIIGEASRHPVGSAPWWQAVGTVIEVSTEHHEREERDILPRYVKGLALSRRKELGRQWCAFMATWRHDTPLRPARQLPQPSPAAFPRKRVDHERRTGDGRDETGL